MHHAPQSALHSAASIDVGARAYADPVLSGASLLASEIMLTMSKARPERRLAVMTRELNKLGPGLTNAVAVEMKRQVERGVKPDQAAFDAMRVVLANRHMDVSIDRVRADAAQRYGWDAVLDDPGLGTLSAQDRQAGCIAAGAGAAVGGGVAVIPVYGTIIGGIMQLGGGIASQALDCGRETREAAAATAAAQAAQAAANLRLAEARAAAEAQRRQMLWLGGGTLAAIAVAAVIILK